MINFDYDKIMQKKTVVHCETEEQANNLLKWADSKGLTWNRNHSYIIYNCFIRYKEKTCYHIYSGCYRGYDYFKKRNYKIYKYEEVIMEDYDFVDENGNIINGWYYIKLGQDDMIEEILNPARMINVFGGLIGKFRTIKITPDMIASKAYKVGETVWGRDSIYEKWIKDKFSCYDFSMNRHYSCFDGLYRYCTNIDPTKKEIEITVKVNGKDVKLSDISEETLLKIREQS